MAEINADDVTQLRHVVRHFRLDPELHEGTHLVVAVLTDEVEFRRRIAEEEQALAARKAAGTASDREYVSGVVLQPGERLPARRSRSSGQRTTSVVPGTAGTSSPTTG